MYNRYYPDEEGIYRKESISHLNPPPEQPSITMQSLPPCQENHTAVPSSPLLNLQLDTGDLLTILVFLTIAGDKAENRLTSLLTLIFYFLL